MAPATAGAMNPVEVAIIFNRAKRDAGKLVDISEGRGVSDPEINPEKKEVKKTMT